MVEKGSFFYPFFNLFYPGKKRERDLGEQKALCPGVFLDKGIRCFLKAHLMLIFFGGYQSQNGVFPFLVPFLYLG